MKCQLHELPDAGKDLTSAERRRLRFCQTQHYPLHVLRKALLYPSLIVKRLRDRIDRTFKLASSRHKPENDATVLGLQPGERVRVKPLKEILATLDETDRFQGMAFMVDEMAPYCGDVFKVRRRVDRFFDERSWRLLKTQHVVILDGVFCEPHSDSKSAYAGCARSCFLFWKEAWLERAESDV